VSGVLDYKGVISKALVLSQT